MRPKIKSFVLTAGSSVAGLVYYLYIVATDHPPAALRLVPVMWLAAAVWALVLSAKGIGRTPRSVLAACALALIAFANLAFAGLFALAALMGD